MRVSLVPPRSYEPEIMDRQGNPYEALAPALRDIARVNRWLGGIKTLWRPVRSLLARDGARQFTLLDVGTGGGEVPRAIARIAGRRGIAARAAGVDLDPQVVRYAARQSLPIEDGGASSLSVLRADAFSLPFADRSFDYVTCSLMFHHFREAEAASLLGELARVARCAVIVNDLVRHWVPWAAITLLTRLRGESAMVRHDGPLSVLRGWSAGELLGLARGAGLLKQARVERLFPYRVVLIIDRRSPE